MANSIRAAIESSVRQIRSKFQLVGMSFSSSTKAWLRSWRGMCLASSFVVALLALLAAKFTEASFNAALEFFDRLNVIKYSSALPDVVFVLSQIPLDKLSELVQYSYKLKHGGHLAPLEVDWKRFCEEGVITLDFLRSFPKHY